VSYQDQLEGGDEPTFKAETVGDTLIGYIVDKYTLSDVLVIQTSDDTSTLNGEQIDQGETLRLFTFGTVLVNEVAKAQPQIGDLCGARYKGPAKTHKPGASPAKLWRFRVFERGTYGQAVEAGKLASLDGAAAAETESAVTVAASTAAATTTASPDASSDEEW
jgi:hypothetical protein